MVEWMVAGKLSENAAEVLEAAWTLEEKGQPSLQNLASEAKTEVTDALIASLCEDRLLTIDSAGHVHLTENGRRLAELIIRRHRLAERLICDVLGARVEESEDAACEFEHVVAENITNSICTLLGHPQFCPHMRPIPEGECCRQAREQLKPIVASCEQLGIGESAKIAYVSAREHSTLARLAALGLTPGVPIRLLQKWPSYVLQCEESEIAIDLELARNLYVWQRAQP